MATEKCHPDVFWKPYIHTFCSSNNLIIQALTFKVRWGEWPMAGWRVVQTRTMRCGSHDILQTSIVWPFLCPLWKARTKKKRKGGPNRGRSTIASASPFHSANHTHTHTPCNCIFRVSIEVTFPSVAVNDKLHQRLCIYIYPEFLFSLFSGLGFRVLLAILIRLKGLYRCRRLEIEKRNNRVISTAKKAKCML